MGTIKMIKQIIILIALFSTIAAESAWGRCPATFVEGKQFERDAYLGKWYEIARHKSTPFQKGDCGTATYSINDAGNIRVENRKKTTEKDVYILGEATATSDPFRFGLVFSDNFFAKLFKGDYRVADTDYKNYSVVYSCFDYFFGKVYYAWILSRTPELAPEVLDNIVNELNTRFEIPRSEMYFNTHNKDYCGEH